MLCGVGWFWCLCFGLVDFWFGCRLRFGISGSFVVVGISGLGDLGFGFLGCVGCTCGFCGGFSGISVALCWVLGLLVFVFERSTWCAWVAVGGYS